MSQNSWKQVAWSLQSRHCALLVPISQHSPSLRVWGEDAGDSRTRPCLGIPPSIKPMTELSLVEYSQIAILHLARQGSYAREGYSEVLWHLKGSEELWASAACPQEDSGQRALLVSPII